MSSFQKNETMAIHQKLYLLHHRRIFKICFLIVGNRMDAEEVTHDVFMRLFGQIENLQDERAFPAWIRSIAIRTSIDRVRRKTHEHIQIEHQSIASDEPYEESDFLLSFKSKLNLLPDGYRTVLSMYLLEDYEFEEIAKVLQIKESSVRSQYVRGRDRIMKQLNIVKK